MNDIATELGMMTEKLNRPRVLPSCLVISCLADKRQRGIVWDHRTQITSPSLLSDLSKEQHGQEHNFGLFFIKKKLYIRSAPNKLLFVKWTSSKWNNVLLRVLDEKFVL